MSFSVARLADPLFFAENRVAAHSDHRWFATADEAHEGVSSYERCLNGTWKFHYAANVGELIDGFEKPGFDTDSWPDIVVPGHLQMQGYDRHQYVNIQYPWDGQEALEPGEVPARDNPVGSYVTSFALDGPLAPGERISVSFKGAETAIAVWLNGRYIGYGCDSFTPSEFDLTDALVDGENKLAAQVFKYSAASWIEDQDFFRFSGLFRDVVLLRRPVAHLEDVRVVTRVADDLARAVVEVTIDLQGAGSVRAVLDGVGNLTDAGEGRFTIEVDAPRLWSAEHPHLYDLRLEVSDVAGTLTEVVPVAVGVRRFGMEDGLLRINGRRVVFTGVNRHDFGPGGRVVTPEETEADIRLMKSVGINAVRTSHYPNNTVLYELCDRYGLYVIDEMNLESHGVYERVGSGVWPLEAALPGDRPEWGPALLDRAASMVQRDKNHPSVVMWSCGNESYGGTTILAVADYFRAVDDRPVHYESVSWDKRYPQTTDVVSEMYTPAAEVEAFLAEHREKPFILCEYAHDMGNSFGAVGKYLELAYREPLLQGMFVWDFADQAVELTDRHGRRFFGYGGDFGDRPHDGDFCGNGILFADHTPKPMIQELKHLYQGLQVVVTDAEVAVTNRYLFTASSQFDCVVVLAREGRTLAEAPLVTDVAPGETATYALPLVAPDESGEYTLDVSFRLREATLWASAGYEVASGQGVVVVDAGRPARALAPGAPTAPELIDGMHNLGVRGRHFSMLFSKVSGELVSYRHGADLAGGRELLSQPPVPNFWHAPTSNERGWGMPFRDGQWALASRYARFRSEPEARVDGDVVEVRCRADLPTTPAGSCDLVYRIDGDGRVEVTLTLHPGAGLPDLPEFGMLFVTDADLHHLRWYGDGPLECYIDRHLGARLGVYSADVRDELTPYLRPQEAGNRTGVRWASVTDDQGAGLLFEASTPMELSALPWTPFEIENARHLVDLPPIQNTIVRPALRRRGVGGDNSWGARTHPEYLIPATDLTFAFAFSGLSGAPGGVDSLTA